MRISLYQRQWVLVLSLRNIVATFKDHRAWGDVSVGKMLAAEAWGPKVNPQHLLKSQLQ